eukprot:3112139-Alexandrium_andersonii.AAC.1
MTSKPIQRPTIHLREAAGRTREKRDIALPQARTRRKSAPPRGAELDAGGAALRTAPPGPRTEPLGVPISSEFGPGIRLCRAFCALGPQPPATGLWASA